MVASCKVALIFAVVLVPLSCSDGVKSEHKDVEFVVDSTAVGAACKGRPEPLADNQGVGYQRSFCAKTEAAALAACKEHCEASLVTEQRCPEGATCTCTILEQHAKACTAPDEGATRTDGSKP